MTKRKVMFLMEQTWAVIITDCAIGAFLLNLGNYIAL